MSRYDGPRTLPAVATVDRSGEIAFGFDRDKGSVTIMVAEDEALLRKIIEPAARLAHDNETFLVPGVPEAESEEQGMEALIAFTNRIHKRLPIHPGQTLRWRDYHNR